MFLMARRIKALGIKVCLTGEGADELFGGKNYNILIRLFVLPQSSKQVGNVRRTS
jgi:asparagine synthetase B (glutamine-hydrolysing)